MWYRVTPRMPYHGDPDYRDAVVKSIRVAFGDVPMETRFFSEWGILEVNVDSGETLTNLPLIGSVRPAVDREMTL